jgi:hypothetical protein
VRGFFVRGGGIRGTVRLDEYEARGIIHLLDYIESCDPGLTDAVAGVFDRGLLEGINRFGFDADIYVDYQHDFDFSRYAFGNAGGRRM